MLGRRLLYLAGLAVFIFASVRCGFAVSTVMLQLSRALQGVGGAIRFVVSLALLADSFRGKDRGVAFGAWGAVTGLAVAIGPLLGGVLTSGLSWRWIFFVNAPIGIAAVIIALAKVAESRGAGQPARLARLLALHGGAVEPGLRAHRVEPAVLHPTAWSLAASPWRPCCSPSSSSWSYAVRSRCST
jgi:MFS family permease